MALVDQPERLAQLVALKAAGMSDNQTAKEMGLAHSTVGRLTKSDNIKQLIASTHRKLLSDNLDNARGNITDVIAKYPTYQEAGDTDNTKLSLKYSAEVLKSIGALPAMAPAAMVTNIFNAGTVVLSPMVQALVDQATARLTAPPDDDDVIDVGDQAGKG